jgi:hypothetical protein
MVLSAAVSVALVAAMVGGFIATRGSGTRSISQNAQILQDLTSGAAATPVPDASSSYVWLTAQGEGSACTEAAPYLSSTGGIPPTVPPAVWDSPLPSPCPGGAADCSRQWVLPSPSGDVICHGWTTEVDVVDWSGTLRYHFTFTRPPSGFAIDGGIVAISPDGTRALLYDGTVIDQTGTTVGDLPAVGTLLGEDSNTEGVGVQWLSDDDGVCIAGPSQLLAGDGTSTSQGATAGDTTLEVVQLGGQTRTVATLATGETSSDNTSVDACNTATDTATGAVVRLDSATGFPTSAIGWSVQLSTGSVIYEQNPPVRTSDGPPWSIGSGDGSLAAEFIWDTKVSGCTSIAVVNVDLGEGIPIAAALTCPTLPVLSADGTRFVVSDINAPADTRTTLYLVDASDGSLIRSVQLPGAHQPSAVAAPDGADLMLMIDGYLVLVDGSGGTSQLQPAGLIPAGGSDQQPGTFNFAGAYNSP